MKHNYNIFSKQELVEFLDKYERDFLYGKRHPFEIMIETKIEALGKRIDINLEESQRLNDAYKTTDDKRQYLPKAQELHEQWIELDKEYKRLSKLHSRK